jgi:hypothetical protein
MRSILLYSILFSSLFLLKSCHEKLDNNKNNTIDTNEELTSHKLHLAELTTDDSVQVNYQIENVNIENFNLLIHLNLFGNTWIISPLELDYPYGGMVFEITENKYFSLIDSIIESPIPVIKNDVICEEPYRIITKKTTLIQKLKLNSIEDFKVSGYLFFVLEPICSPITLNFNIVNNSGKLTVQKSDSNYSFSNNQ